MRNTLVWDLPVRLFHWTFAACALAAVAIGLLVDDDSAIFPYHALLGLTLALVVVLRLVWALFGTRYARFDSLLVPPATVVQYLIGVMRGRDTRHTGRNPAAAYAVVTMFLLALLLAATGIAMTAGAEFLKEVHEVLTYAFLVVATAHVVGVAIHTVRFREPLILSMIDGRTSGSADAGISSSRPLVAALFLALVAVWAIGLWRGYDPSTGSAKLPFTGVSLAIGENEGGRDHETEDE